MEPDCNKEKQTPGQQACQINIKVYQ